MRYPEKPHVEWTDHALDRCRERGRTTREVESMLWGLRVPPGEKLETKAFVVRGLKGGGLCVITVLPKPVYPENICKWVELEGGARLLEVAS